MTADPVDQTARLLKRILGEDPERVECWAGGTTKLVDMGIDSVDWTEIVLVLSEAMPPDSAEFLVEIETLGELAAFLQLSGALENVDVRDV